mmetsp:Transcript_2675/g.10886  ORF Transcript_2675/g.10886 Transcript_2675/m.10886 type:complete len:225 (-) Transcript_2675:1024-1698(-)
MGSVGGVRPPRGEPGAHGGPGRGRRGREQVHPRLRRRPGAAQVKDGDGRVRHGGVHAPVLGSRARGREARAGSQAPGRGGAVPRVELSDQTLGAGGDGWGLQLGTGQRGALRHARRLWREKIEECVRGRDRGGAGPRHGWLRVVRHRGETRGARAHERDPGVHGLYRLRLRRRRRRGEERDAAAREGRGCRGAAGRDAGQRSSAAHCRSRALESLRLRYYTDCL